MIIQILNFSFPEVLSYYCKKYKIHPEYFCNGIMGMELRGNSTDYSENIKRIVLEKNEFLKEYINKENDNYDFLMLGSIENFKMFAKEFISAGDKSLEYKMNDVINNYENIDNKIYKIGNKEFNFSNAYVMGILNVTPDSFSDGGAHFDKDNAVKYGIQLLDEGADIIDIGGESTRPGAAKISEENELNRILPVIKGILAERNEAIISVDTTKPVVAEETLKSGARIINDISGLTFYPEMLYVIKKYEASVIIMHIKGNPLTMQENPVYKNLMQEIYDFLYLQSQLALNAGVNNIFIDPGIGFGKSIDHNFEIIKRIGDLKSLGFPILIGNSRKSFIGKTLNLDPQNRDLGSAVMNAVSIRNGVRIIRTHNVRYGVQTINLINKIR
ncbi:MAG: dihydropteroate synthase [Ignavibacteriaceae bacterium]|nr:dihydropteroate synthase [Ignavibacteriaceae bacterium]